MFTSELVNRMTKEEEKTRVEIAAYKVKAMAMVSQKAAAVLEKVTKIVLTKSLTVRDQGDLIIEAIEQAKKEEFLWN